MSARSQSIRSGTALEADHYWMSYSDLMAGVLLMFILLLVLALQQNAVERSTREAEIQSLRLRIEQQLGISQRIIAALEARIREKEQVLRIEVDQQTGAIRFGEGILFDYGSARPSPAGRQQLDSFFPLYAEVLLGDPEFRPHVAQIIVEGHTDSDGGYMSNLALSQARATAVTEHLLMSSRLLPWREELERFLTANGRSESEPIDTNATDAGRQNNRRIEFKFRLRDQEAFAELQRILIEAREVAP